MGENTSLKIKGLGDKDSRESGMDILIVIGQLLPFLYVTKGEDSNSGLSINSPETM
jgi:hypothetical protein